MQRFYLAVAMMMVAQAAAALPPSQPEQQPQPSFVPPEAPPSYDDKLLGDGGGARAKLVDAGIDVNLHYSGDVWDVLGGGTKRIATYLDYIELRTNLDGEKLFGIKGNTISVSLIDGNGTRTNGSTVGSIQGIDNNEVPSNGVRLYEAWVQQEFFDGRASLKVGIEDLNYDFDSTHISDNFLQPTMQLGQSLAGSGRNGPSTFPYDSLAARLKVKPTEETYIQAAAYDGVPGDPRTNSGDPIHLNRQDGLLLMGEVGFSRNDDMDRLAIGTWHYTRDLANLANPAVQSKAQGIYALSSYRFYQDAVKQRDLGAYWRGGAADGDTQQTNWDMQTGIVGHGWVSTRPQGEFGLGVALAHNGAAYLHAQEAAGTPSTHMESVYELYYRDSVARGITLQPDLQYIVDPGTDPDIRNAWVTGLRLDVAF